MLNTLRSLVIRIGRRGSYLLFLAILDFVYGYSLLAAVNPALQKVNLFLPLEAWGIAWLIVGVICLVQAFAKLDRVAFSLAVTIKALWGLAFVFSWGFTTTAPLGWLSGVVWITFAIMTAIISYWPEQRRFRIEDL